MVNKKKIKIYNIWTLVASTNGIRNKINYVYNYTFIIIVIVYENRVIPSSQYTFMLILLRVRKLERVSQKHNCVRKPDTSTKIGTRESERKIISGQWRV